MNGLNKALLIGHVGAKPEVRHGQNGKPIVTFNLATGKAWRDQATGERRERTEWHRIVIFNEALCKVAEDYVKKGSKLYLEGEIITRKWFDEKTSSDRWTTEITLSGFAAKLVLLDKAERSNPPPAEDPYDFGSQSSPPASTRRDDMDDEIPF